MGSKKTSDASDALKAPVEAREVVLDQPPKPHELLEANCWRPKNTRRSLASNTLDEKPPSQAAPRHQKTMGFFGGDSWWVL